MALLICQSALGVAHQSPFLYSYIDIILRFSTVVKKYFTLAFFRSWKYRSALRSRLATISDFYTYIILRFYRFVKKNFKLFFLA